MASTKPNPSWNAEAERLEGFRRQRPVDHNPFEPTCVCWNQKFQCARWAVLGKIVSIDHCTQCGRVYANCDTSAIEVSVVEYLDALTDYHQRGYV